MPPRYEVIGVEGLPEFRQGADLAALIKPQFEAGREQVGRGGIVRDEDVRQAVCARIGNWLADSAGWRVDGIIASPITGADGNLEYLIAAHQPPA